MGILTYCTGNNIDKPIGGGFSALNLIGSGPDFHLNSNWSSNSRIGSELEAGAHLNTSPFGFEPKFELKVHPNFLHSNSTI